MASPADVAFDASITDVRSKSDLGDYTGELQVQLPLKVTDTRNGLLQSDPATGATTLPITIPCTATSDAAVGSTCALSTTLNALTPDSVVAGDRAIWELGDVKVLDGGPDGVAMTPDNTLFARPALFAP